MPLRSASYEPRGPAQRVPYQIVREHAETVGTLHAGDEAIRKVRAHSAALVKAAR